MMIICFECSDDRKREMDKLIAEGGYRDYSEFISVAIANQLLLHARVGVGGGIVMEPTSTNTRGQQSNPARASVRAVTEDNVAVTASSPVKVPDVFRPPKTAVTEIQLALPSEDFFSAGEQIPLERWVFGQFNRLLPAKVSCRAIANMLPASKGGLELGLAAVEIAREAANLAIELKRRDLLKSTERDDQLSTAFPSASSAEKGIARYSSQFVGAMNNRGQLTGLLASLKLIGRLKGKKSLISLTEAGWQFASMGNPCLDGENDVAAEKLSKEEREFLRNHIQTSVPQELSAYKTIIELIEKGCKTPDTLDVALQKHVSPTFNATPSFIATQRSGAISRMTDLALVSRERQGLRVSYAATSRAKQFLKGLDHE